MFLALLRFKRDVLSPSSFQKRCSQPFFVSKEMFLALIRFKRDVLSPYSFQKRCSQPLFVWKENLAALHRFRRESSPVVYLYSRRPQACRKVSVRPPQGSWSGGCQYGRRWRSVRSGPPGWAAGWPLRNHLKNSMIYSGRTLSWNRLKIYVT